MNGISTRRVVVEPGGAGVVAGPRRVPGLPDWSGKRWHGGIAAIKEAGYLHVPEGRRDHTGPAETLRLHGLD